MVDGALSLMTPIYAMQAGGRLTAPRGENKLDSGAYFYEVYECADGQYISLAPIEAKFHAELLRLLEIDPAGMPPQRDKTGWARWKDRADRAVPHPHPRRLVPHPGRHGCLFRARCCRWPRPTPIRIIRRAIRLHRCRRSPPAGPGAPFRHDEACRRGRPDRCRSRKHWRHGTAAAEIEAVIRGLETAAPGFDD